MKKQTNIVIQWHITENCRNRCKHCYIEKSAHMEASIKDMNIVFSKIQEFEELYNVNIGNFVITGGDPFENPAIKNLLSLLYDADKTVSILGIPERITEESIRQMKELNVSSYQVSIDGMKDIHDSIRGAGSFDRTIESLKKMNMYELPTKVMFTISKSNAKDLVPLIRYLHDEKIRTLFAFDFLVFQGNAAKSKECHFESKEVQKIIDDYVQIQNEVQQLSSTVILGNKTSLLKAFWQRGTNWWRKYSEFNSITGCSCGFSGLTILPNGDVYPCRRLPVKVGNLMEDSFEKVFLGNPLMRRFRRISNYSYCVDCKYANVCRGCPAVTYSLMGDPFEQYPYCYLKEKSEEKYLNIPPMDVTNIQEMDFILHMFPNVVVNQADSHCLAETLIKLKKSGVQ